jgi:putative transposase
MKRIESSHDVRFLTFSTYLRLPLFNNDRIKDLLADHLAAAKDRFRFNLYAWVIMPEHVHLVLWPRIPEAPVAYVLSELKRRFAHIVIGRWRELHAPGLDRL